MGVLTWESHCTMRAVVFVLLGAVAINAEAEADPYLVHHIGVGHTVAGVYNAHVPGVYSHPYHLNVVYGKPEAEPEAEADPLMYHHTGVAGVAGVHPVHTSVYNHHVVPAVHHGVNHVAGLYNAPVSTVNHLAGVHHAGVYNTYPYLG